MKIMTWITKMRKKMNCIKPELKPCPFCKGKAIYEVYTFGSPAADYARIYCSECGAFVRQDISAKYSAADEVVGFWNNRGEENS